MSSPYVVALRQPLHLAMLGLTVVAGLCAAWWLFPVGLLLWGLMVLRFSRDPSHRISHQLQSRGPLAPRFQPLFDKIERAQVSLFNALAATDGRTRRALEPVRDAVDSLTDEAHALCQRMTTLENHRLVASATEDSEQALRQLDEQIAHAQDDMVRRELQNSRLAVENRHASLRASATYLARVEAQLSTLASEMDGVLTEVIRLQALGPEQAAREVAPLTHKLREQARDLKQFQQEAAIL